MTRRSGGCRQIEMSESFDKDSGIENSHQTAGIRVAKNTAILILLRVGVPLLSVLLMLVLARKLGTEGIGRYALAYSLLELFNTIGPLGLYAVITREGSRNRPVLEKMLANAITMGSMVSLLLIVVMIVTGKVLGYDEQTQQILVILSFAILPCTIGYFLEGASVAIEKMNFIAYSTLLEYVIKVGIGVALLLAGYGLESVMIVAVVGRFASAILNALFLKHEKIRVSFGFDPDMIRKLLRLCPAFLFIGIFATLYWRIDILMLSWMRPLEDVGLYGAAYRLFNFAILIPASLSLALYPQMTRLMQQDQEQLVRLGRIALRYLFALTLPIAVALTIIGKDALILLFSNDFQSAATTVAVLAWALIPYGVVRYNAYLLFAADRQNVDLVINIIMALLNILMNLLLIPRYGHLGAAIATLCSISIYSVFQGLYIRHQLPDIVPKLSIPLSVLIGSIVLLIVLWLGMKVSVITTVCIAPFIYLATLLRTGFFSKAEIEILKLDNLVNRFGFMRFIRN